MHWGFPLETLLANSFEEVQPSLLRMNDFSARGAQLAQMFQLSPAQANTPEKQAAFVPAASFRASIQPTHTIAKNFRRCLKPCFRVACYTAVDN